MRHAVLALAAALLAASPASAQTYPDKAITMVVPYAAGGPSDVIGRLIGQHMSATLGQQVVIENVAGAGGTTGAARVAKASPDGYTLLIHHVALAAGASLYQKLAYDTATAFQPIGLVNTGPFVLTSKLGFDAADGKALLAKLKAEGPKINVAHAGIGSGSHLCGLMLTQALGTSFTYVAYRGTGPAMNDLVGGQVDLLCDQTTNAIPQVNGGKVKAYAVTAPRRIDQLPNLPTVAELGIDGFDVAVWHALYAPAGTPKPVVDKLHGALQAALADATIQARFTELGTVLFPADRRSPDALAAHLKGELARWNEAITKAGVKAE
ncbi:MAG: tripartite tricarboxylate transporter substrate-binding protein [Burkholderiales bacterium]|nr:tripartite tricarboxylate transporter substrate-binding protein [Burkholderiales bacterium]